MRVIKIVLLHVHIQIGPHIDKPWDSVNWFLWWIFWVVMADEVFQSPVKHSNSMVKVSDLLLNSGHAYLEYCKCTIDVIAEGVDGSNDVVESTGQKQT